MKLYETLCRQMKQRMHTAMRFKVGHRADQCLHGYETQLKPIATLPSATRRCAWFYNGNIFVVLALCEGHCEAKADVGHVHILQ